MRSMRVVVGLSAAVISTVVFSGCVAQPESIVTSSPTSSSAPERSATPSSAPMPEAEEQTQPASRFGFDCTDLEPIISAAYDEQLSPTSEIHDLDEASGPGWLPGPPQYAFAQLGDLYCEFGRQDARRLATVTVVADASEAYADMVSYYGEVENGCNSYQCSGAALNADAYIAVYFDGVLEAFESVAIANERADTVLAGVSSMVSEDERHEEDASDPRVLSGFCEEYLSLEQVEAIFGTDDLELSRPSGGWSIEAWIIDEPLSALPCYYMNLNSNLGGILAVLPGGAWAYDSVVSGDGDELSVGSDDAEAVLDCDTVSGAYYSCYVDISVAGDWFRFTFFPGANESADLELAGTQIASHIIDSYSM
ncbi:hypothetical protein FHX48_000399 [Microbacterium halimionae]|uniref:DUF3558 domain-containing protein n=1 Tax=Microbacterium halimionae TaxID=1526413 RepID=A0A7W3JM23_9MICO|nr:hypothetical protein [Microbacterium halimionae]MBA8815347.1 hypothetical protein [Microbacterium halimionae]NII93862.1 hypothetical protein [Microbacterium halimionae]